MESKWAQVIPSPKRWYPLDLDSGCTYVVQVTTKMLPSCIDAGTTDKVSAGRQKSGQWGYTSSIQVVPLNCYVSVSKAGKYNMMCVALICN
jgi:hypothetical protein